MKKKLLDVRYLGRQVRDEETATAGRIHVVGPMKRLCLCVCVCVCVFKKIILYTNICVHKCICMYVCMSVCVCVCVCVCDLRSL